MNGNSPPERLATATPSPTLSLASSDLNPSDSCTPNRAVCYRAVCSLTIACSRKHSFPSTSAVLAPLSATQTRRQSLDARVPPSPSSIAGRSFGRSSGALSPASPPLLPCSRSNSLPTAALSPGPPSSPQMALPPKIHFSTHYTTATAAAEAAADALSVFAALGGILMNELVFVIKTRVSPVMVKMGWELVF